MNLIFLAFARKKWSRENLDRNKLNNGGSNKSNSNESKSELRRSPTINVSSLTVLQRSQVSVSQWIGKKQNTSFLVISAMMSGSLSATLSLVNSKIFGM